MNDMNLHTITYNHSTISLYLGLHYACMRGPYTDLGQPYYKIIEHTDALRHTLSTRLKILQGEKGQLIH